MLKDLKILNGTLELKFNEYTYEYTVLVDDTVKELEFEYKLDDDCNINIRNNILTENENIVYLDVYSIDKEITYTFYVNKENTNLTNGIDNYKKSLELSYDNEIELYKVQILSVSLFLIIILIFTIMFKKRKYTK